MHAQTAPSAEDYLKSAIGHVRSKEPDKALTDLDQAVKLNPRLAEAFLLRASVRDQKGDKEGALSDYNTAIDLMPAGPGIEAAYNNRSLIRLIKGDGVGALTDINMAIKLNPVVPAFYNQRAIIKLQSGDADGAVADYEKALALSPKLPSAYYGRGAYRFQKGDFDGAISDFSRAIELKQDYSSAYVSRGLAHGLKGDIDPAIEDLKKGLALNPGAVSDQGKGNFTTPVKDLSRFILSHPTNARAYEFRGILRLIQSKETEAKQDFSKSLELDSQLKSEIDRVAEAIRTPKVR
ncbi:MAG TPA: tetratricopeptide repeat protein [Pyrinomonadaceae bacterium]|nr:tetratricopeptide repeat protein [Pyrinomonadaceae bacterium]